jgi:hypothetical protein
VKISSAELMMVDIETAFLMRGPVSRIRECIGFIVDSVAMFGCCARLACDFSFDSTTIEKDYAAACLMKGRAADFGLYIWRGVAQISQLWRGVVVRTRQGKFLEMATGYRALIGYTAATL